MIKLSIIIPYYNTYNYTVELLNVLSKQLNEQVEVILIDDGCHEERLDTFTSIKITHLDKNYGASYAWNRGIEQATGKYIGFIDSDDMITEDYIAVLLDAIDHEYADEIIFGFTDMENNCVSKHPICRAIWKAIYKREICPTFDENILYNTDVPFKEQLERTLHSKYYLDNVIYFYRSVREGSITWLKERRLLKHKKEE